MLIAALAKKMQSREKKDTAKIINTRKLSNIPKLHRVRREREILLR